MTERLMQYALILALLLPCMARAGDTSKDAGDTIRHGIKSASNLMGNALDATGKAIKNLKHEVTAGNNETRSPDKQPHQSKDQVSGSQNQKTSTVKKHMQGVLHNFWR